LLFDSSTSRGSRSILFLAVCCLGVSAFMTQLTLMRELLTIFSGNELVFGITLGNWLLLTGIGSALGKTSLRLKSPLRALVLAQVCVAVLPIVNVFLLRTLRNVVFIRGAEVGVTETVVSCFVLLAPYCLIAGYMLTLACLVLASKEDATSIGQVYFLDNIGDVVGGVLFSLALIYIHRLNHFQILYFPALLNLVFAVAVAATAGKRLLAAAAAVVAAVLIALIVRCDPDGRSLAIEYAPQRVAFHGHSPYGSLVVTESAGQYNFIENGVSLFSTHNVEQVEQTVHYAMAQRPGARRVLLISGGAGGTALEILKYGVEAVDYVELDPLILSVARQFVPENLDDPRINVINNDGRRFVKLSPHCYDVVIVDVPDPSTSQINRFYTWEFFEEVERVLAPDGVLAFSLGRYENYVSRELADLIAVADRTARRVFGDVMIVPSGRIFFLASDGEITSEFAERIKAAGIETRLVTEPYLRAMLTADRQADVRRALRDDAPINKDFSPVLYYYHLRWWISRYRLRFGLLEGALLAALVIYLLKTRPVPLAIFTTGLAASALQVVLLIGFQILYGCVYHQVSLIVTMFMAGLGIGSLVMNRMLPRRGRGDLIRLEAAVAAYATFLPLVLITLGRLDGTAAAVATRVAVPLLSMLLAVLVGMEFPLAGKIDFQQVTATAARLYTADYIGAALGALLVSTLLIPLIGVIGVCLLAAGLNAASAMMLLFAGR